MKNAIIILFIALLHFSLSRNVFSQISIGLPKLPGIGKTKTGGSGKTGTSGTAGTASTNVNNTENNVIYPTTRPTGTPVLLKNSVYVQAETHREYWKAPNESNYSSWVPKLSFRTFYNNEKPISYVAEYFNPDGSLWFSEKLKQDRASADRTISFESSATQEMLNTKSSVATGVYSFKVTEQDSGQVLIDGKFKVGKFKTSSRPAEKKFDFYVDHDWLLPYGMIGFHHSDIEIGGIPPLISFWLKGQISASELEGRLFYQGKQIASTTDTDGASGVSDYDERTTSFSAAFAPETIYKRWEFQFGNFRIDNNGSFNRENYPNSHFGDKNPGDYTIKIYRNGTQIREMSFTIGSDGRFVRPPYASQIPLPYHRVILPVKVTSAEAKWAVGAWKTDSFYGNPLTGFAAQ